MVLKQLKFTKKFHHDRIILFSVEKNKNIPWTKSKIEFKKGKIVKINHILWCSLGNTI